MNNNPEKIVQDLKDEPIKIGIHVVGGLVAIQFDRPITLLQMSKKEARIMATRLNKVAL